MNELSGYSGGMKVKTSVTLSESLLAEIDQLQGSFRSRSEFLEVAARAYLLQLSRDLRDKRDLEILQLKADDLNAEAEDHLAYQAIP